MHLAFQMLLVRSSWVRFFFSFLWNWSIFFMMAKFFMMPNAWWSLASSFSDVTCEIRLFFSFSFLFPFFFFFFFLWNWSIFFTMGKF